MNVRVALRATDDPDSKDGIDHASGTWWHVYDIWGEPYGGAPEAASVWLRRAKRRLEAGHKRRASKALGYLAHIVGDVAQPMHTDSSERETDSVHSGYEQAVDSFAGSLAWFQVSTMLWRATSHHGTRVRRAHPALRLHGASSPFCDDLTATLGTHGATH